MGVAAVTCCMLLWLSAVCAATQGPVVHTGLGALHGQSVSVKGTTTSVHNYLGIPFARPPVGPLRLARPQPADGWEGLRDATKQPFMCVQNKKGLDDVIVRMELGVELPDISEDCLYLNIHTPATASVHSKLPVMVWIHGGGFCSGAASVYDGSALAACRGDPVPLGPARVPQVKVKGTGDGQVPGNMGMLDQVEALRWVQQHIHHFGGDAGLVTVFGESAGSVSASLLAMSPLATGLFHRAIAQSGAAGMPQMITENPQLALQPLAYMSGCDASSTARLTMCLKNIGTEAIVALSLVDENYQSLAVSKVPFMTGVNSDEGGLLLPSGLAPPDWVQGMGPEPFMAMVSMYYADPRDQKAPELLAKRYLGNAMDRVKNRQGFTSMIGDMMFRIPAIHSANAHRDAGAPVYLYEYQYTLEEIRAKRPSFVGSDHGDEISTVLGFCFTTTHVKLSILCTEEEQELSKLLMAYWANFARTGSPNGPGLVEWPQYGAGEDYLSIDMEQTPQQWLAKESFEYMTRTLPMKLRAPHQEL
ncbi:hypothetical protein CRUP_005991 [Coryphaenoides rupestris]|nr:hypothetical protein CRUP_005991 [Coryphaenoides rupestris]